MIGIRSEGERKNRSCVGHENGDVERENGSHFVG